MSQLNFMQSFVEDMLDLRQIRNGNFTLVPETFNVSHILTLVSNIFEHQAKAKRCKIIHEISDSLKLPDEQENRSNLSNLKILQDSCEDQQ